MSAAPATTPRPDPTPGKPPPGFLLPLVAFCAGAAVMIIEISGNRLIAPVFGNTIYTWTALIGVILVAMSAGGYLGGRLADRQASARTVGVLLGVAGVATVLIPAAARWTENWVAQTHLIAGPLAMASALFVVPGVLLGAISPYAVKLLSVWRPDHAVGKSAGLVSMSGSLGSFAGTFATGFWLLSAFDLRLILAATGGFLGLLAVAVWAVGGWKGSSAVALGVALAGGAALGLGTPLSSASGALFAKNTYYHLIRVKEEEGAGHRVRLLMLDSTVEGGINLGTGTLPLAYQNYWEILANAAAFRPERVLFLGAGAFGMPVAFSRKWPAAKVEVAEIDPEVVAVGRKFFGLDGAPAVAPVVADGRRWLRSQPAGSYDFIFGDAYNGVSYIPPHLATTEFFAIVADRLKHDGVYMMNLISPLRDESAPLAGAILAALRQHFPHLAAFYVARADPRLRQNLILMASKSPLDPFLEEASAGSVLESTRGQALLRTRVPAEVLGPLAASGRPFTDTHNPVDLFIARLLLKESDPAPRVF